MRTPPLLADFTHIRVCKPFCEKSLTLPAALIDYSKPPPLVYNRTLATSSGLVFCAITSNHTAYVIFKKEKADNRILICVLSALRLCVRLFDN